MALDANEEEDARKAELFEEELQKFRDGMQLNEFGGGNSGNLSSFMGL